MMELDHLVVAGETLEEAAVHTELALGSVLQPGGRHLTFGTHNRLMGLGQGQYLEAIAIDPSLPAPDFPRWFGLDSFKGPARLDKWVCRVTDIEAALAALPMAGRPIELQRDALRWTMAVPEDGVLPFDGVFPALIQWHGATMPGLTLTSQGFSLEQLDVLHPEAEALEALLAPFLIAPKVRFVQASSAALRANIKTPMGEKQLQ